MFTRKRFTILAMVTALFISCTIARAGDFSLSRSQGSLISINEGELSFMDASFSSIGNIMLNANTEHVFLSEGGAYAAVFTYSADVFPIKSAIAVYDCLGNLAYSLSDVVATGGCLSETGSLLSVGYLGEGPQAPAELSLFSAEGILVISWRLPTFKEAYFSSDGSQLLILSPTEGSLVYNALNGDLVATLPAATLGAIDQGYIYLVSKDRLLVYQDGNLVADASSGIDFPRELAFEPGKSGLIIAGKDRLVAVDDGQLSWTLPEASFSITSLSTTTDLQKIAVGATDRQGNGLIYLLDGSLNPIKTISVTLTKESGKIPRVAIADSGTIWVNTGDQLVKF